MMDSNIHNALIQGWIVGKRLAAMRGKQEPVAYLYNGDALPSLPDGNKTHDGVSTDLEASDPVSVYE